MRLTRWWYGHRLLVAMLLVTSTTACSSRPDTSPTRDNPVNAAEAGLTYGYGPVRR